MTLFKVLDSTLIPPTPILDTEILLFTEGMTYYISFMFTDEAGVSVDIPADDYIAVISKPGRVFTNNNFAVTVTGADDEVVLDGVGHDVVIPIPDANLIRAYVQLADPQGQPLVGAEVSITVEPAPPLLIDVRTAITGIAPVIITTDADGYAETYLVRGMNIQVVIVGTAFYREFTTPTDPAITEWNLMEAASAAPDYWSPRKDPEKPLDMS